MLEREDLAAGLWILADTFGVRLSDGRIDAYHQVLSRRFLSAAEWRQVVARAAEDCERFPIPRVLLSLRPRSYAEPHKCELCRQTPGFVYGSRFRGRGHLVPCPYRADQRAEDWYVEKAEERRSTPAEERNTAEASHLAIRRDWAESFMRRVDPEGRMFAQGNAALEPKGEKVRT